MDLHSIDETHPEAGGMRVVTVLGMHRSATSTLTRVLNLLGVNLGDPGDFIPPGPDNPRGFFENRPLVLVNDRILSLLGGRWDAPPDLPTGWVSHPTLQALEGPAGEVFDRLGHGLEGSTVIGWKDPRTCLLLPFWEAVLASRTRDHRMIHVVRRPDEVVASLARRDGLSPEHAARLWVRHVADALVHAPDALLVPQALLFDDPMGTVDLVCDHLALARPTATVRDTVHAHLDRGLLHQAGRQIEDGPWVDLAREVFAELEAGGAARAEVGRRARVAAAEIHGGRQEPQIVVTGYSAAAEAVRRLPQTGARAGIVLPSSAPCHLIYAWESDGWSTHSGPIHTVLRDLEPAAVLSMDDDADRRAVDAVVAHAPSTRLVARRGSRLAPVVDDELDFSAPTALADLQRLVVSGPPGVREPRLGKIPDRRVRPGVVSVVMPVHGKWELTAASLDALAAHTHHDLEVVVVDDASPDDSRARARARPDVAHLVALDHNVGFAAAANHGLRATSGEYVCVLNNDTEVTPGWLQSLMSALRIPGTGLVGPRSNRISGWQQIQAAPSFTELSPEALHRWARTWSADRPDIAWQTNRLVGFCLLARREVLVQLGGFDEGVGRGNYEDDELCTRVRNAGLTCRVAERAVVLHHGSATFGDDPRTYLRSLLEGARHTSGRLRLDAPVATALVLDDGDHAAAVQTAMQALPLTGSVEIWSRTEPVASTNLPPQVVSRSFDWEDDDAVAMAALRLPSPRLLVLGAGEQLVVGDLEAARHALEVEAAGGGLGTGEIRLVENSRDGIASVGGPSRGQLPHVRLASLAAVD